MNKKDIEKIEPLFLGGKRWIKDCCELALDPHNSVSCINIIKPEEKIKKCKHRNFSEQFATDDYGEKYSVGLRCDYCGGDPKFIPLNDKILTYQKNKLKKIKEIYKQIKSPQFKTSKKYENNFWHFINNLNY